MSTIFIQLAIALAVFTTGVAGGIKWEKGVQAREELAAREAREADQRQQRKFNDVQAGQHAETVAHLNDQLGDARGKIASLKPRACLDHGTVSLLNATGVPQRRGATASEPASAAASAAAGTGLRWSTNVDVGSYIALCRTRHAELSEQLNSILDIEDRRHPPATPSTAKGPRNDQKN